MNTLFALDGLSARSARGELFTWAATRETFQPSNLVAKWLEKYGSAEGAQPTDAVHAALELQSLGTACVDSRGEESLRLPFGLRMQVLQQIGPAPATAVLARLADDDLTVTERFFRDLLERRAVAVDKCNRVQLVALAEAVRWARATGVECGFNEDELHRKLARHDFLQVIGGDDLHRFVGRTAVRAMLANVWGEQTRPMEAVLIEGPGGIGKSLAVARFVADLLESDDPADRPDAVFHIDFDRAPLQHANPVLVLKEVLRQAARWTQPQQADDLVELDHRLGSGKMEENFASQTRSISYHDRNLMSIVSKLMQMLAPARPPRIVFFADTFEQVEQLDDFAARAVKQVCEMFARSCERLLVIYAGRVFLDPRALSDRAPVRVQEFSPREADTYLVDEAARAGLYIGSREAKRVRDVVGRTPLALRLAVGVLEQAGGGIRPGDWERITAKSPELVQAAVYDRLLRRLKDPDLKKVALPSLLLRRITAPVIREVLAPACGLSLKDGDDVAVMQRMQAEWRLFVPLYGEEAQGPVSGAVVSHRHDVRASLLPNLHRALDAAQVLAVNEAAVRYYMTTDNPVFRTEELYHRLRLGQGADELDLRWDEKAGAALRGVLGEFPSEARSYLRARLGSASRVGFAGVLSQVQAPSGRGLAAFDSATEEFRIYARKLLQTGGPAPEILEQLDGDGYLTSYLAQRHELGDIYAAALMRAGKYDRLLQFAREVSARPSRKALPSVVASVLVTAASLQEGMDLLGEAQSFWIRALRAAEGQPPVSLLPCLVGSARVRRKLATGPELRLREMERAASGLDARDLRQHMTLARELSAELGELLFSEAGPRARELSSLLSFVLESDEAFPSAVDSPGRVREIAMYLFGRPVEHTRALNSMALSTLYSSDPEGLRKLVDALRQEVDWTLRKAVEVRPVLSAAASSVDTNLAS